VLAWVGGQRRQIPARLRLRDVRRSRSHNRRAEVARDAHRHAVAFEFDLGEARFVEQFRQIADHIVIDGLAFSASAGSRACAPRSILGADHGGEAIDGERVALVPKPQSRRAPQVTRKSAGEILACVNIGDVHFDDRGFHHEERVKDRNRRRRIARRIDDQADRLFGARLLNPIDDFAFVIGLTKYDERPWRFAVARHSFSTSASVAWP
jgi:hypothetical protein